MKKTLNIMLSGLVVLNLGACTIGNTTSLDKEDYLEAKNECDPDERYFEGINYIHSYLEDITESIRDGKYSNLHVILEESYMEAEVKSMEYNTSYVSGAPKPTCQLNFERKLIAGLADIGYYFTQWDDPSDTMLLEDGIEYLKQARDYYGVVRNATPIVLDELIEELEKVLEGWSK